jgi:hypothetical protein
MTVATARTVEPGDGFLQPQHVRLIKLGRDEYGMWYHHQGGREEHFIGWPALRAELQAELLPLLFKQSFGCRLSEPEEVGSDHAIAVLTPEGRYAYLWLGFNPDTRKHDGFLHVGGRDVPHIWQTYVRGWDGQYVLRSAVFDTLEDARAVSGV